MNISIITLFEQLYEPFLNSSLIGRARESKKITTQVVNLFSLVPPKKHIDAPTVGHGAGMLLRPEVVELAIEQQIAAHGPAYKIFFSPHGEKLDQIKLSKIAHKAQQVGHLMVIAGRYEGMDARVEERYADEIISIGDFVAMGGDLPAMLLLEGLLRFVPGVVGRQESVEQDSFSGPFVDYPEYTLPVTWQGMTIPEVLRSGNHAAIREWRMEQAVKRSVLKHFEWVRSYPTLSEEDKKRVQKAIPPHYVVLMHDDVKLKNDVVGTTSVTSIDVHDIARSARTYDIAHSYMVTPLKDQQALVQTLLDFWLAPSGEQYNVHRHDALKRVSLIASLDEALADIEKREGKKPLLIATSAREHSGKTITYRDQGMVWQHERPVVFVLGTGHGLSDQIINRCDFILEPLRGLDEFNHLSVRTAAGIIFDRWLGLNPKGKDLE